jgi:hypothetical protein
MTHLFGLALILAAASPLAILAAENWLTHRRDAAFDRHVHTAPGMSTEAFVRGAGGGWGG